MSVSGVLIVALYFVLVCTPAALAAWLAPPAGGFAYEAGRAAALTGFAILVLQTVLAARWKYASRPFGLDIVFRFHRNIALFAGVLLVAHPILLAAGGAGPGLILRLDAPWYIWLGRIALVLLLLNLVLSACRNRLRIAFERWRFVHDVVGPLLLVVAFTHAWFIGGDLQHPLIRTVSAALLAGGVAIFVYHRLIRPVLLRRHPWRVTAVQPETDTVCTLELEPPASQATPDYLPGQWHFLTLHRNRGLPHEEHHFTISSSPTRPGRVTSTIKNIGDFTATIPDTRVGDTASVHTAFGRFSYRVHPDESDLVFIAGGIGITPLMSMLRCMSDRKDGRRVLLLYANRTEDAIVFRDELDTIAAGHDPHLTVVHVISRPGDDWTGEKGHIDRDLLQRRVQGDLSKKTFYICGPAPLMDAAIADLAAMGVKDRQIRTEIFRLID
ncbi:MAG: ferric reductase-like transmembrane domain-containing protein [Phycisphaerae bacterium]|nr:ferric reductase-like transmembrane domain-containing protein [Phycisphaerae bacterium]